MTFDAAAIRAWIARQHLVTSVWGPCIRPECGNHTRNLSGVCRDHLGEK